MAGPDVVADMVGRLGFQVDDDGLRKFEKGLEDAKEGSDSLGVSGVALGEVLGNVATKALELGTALVTSAAAGARDLIVEFARSSKELDAWATKIAIAPEQLQRLEFAAKSLGGEAEDVREGLQTWQESLGEMARLGSGPAVDSLGTLGLRLSDLEGLDPAQSLQVFADALTDLPSDAQQVSVALEVLGGEGAKLLPLLKQGGAGIQELMDKADDLGLVLDESAIRKGIETQEALAGIGNTTEALKNAIAVGLAPTVTDLAERFGEWYAANEEVIAQKVPEVVDAIIEGVGELVTYGRELASGVENLTGLFTRLGDEGEGAGSRIVDTASTAIEWSKAGIEAFVAWTDAVAAMADLVWDVAGAIKDGLVTAYEYVEPVIDSASDSIESQTGILSRVVDFVEGLVERVLQIRDVVSDVVETAGIGKAFSAEDRAAIKEAREAARSPAVAARQAAEEERAYQERVSEYADQLISDAEKAEISKGRRKRGQAFQRRALAAAAGGGGDKVDTREVNRLLGDEIRSLGQSVGATSKAQRAALTAAAKSLDAGDSLSVARSAAIASLGKSTDLDLSGAGGTEAALFRQLTEIGGAEAARSATDGAKFVNIDQSVTVNVGGIALEIPESYATALGDQQISDGVTQALRRGVVDYVFAPIVDAQAARSARP